MAGPVGRDLDWFFQQKVDNRGSLGKCSLLN